MSKENLAPVVLFVYNRPDHTRKTVESLLSNELSKDSLLYIYSDAAASLYDSINVNIVREFIKNIKGFREIKIIERPENYGLAKSIITGVGEVIDKYGKVIVLEDDLITSPFFLEYMNEALDLYDNVGEVMHVSGYMFPITGKWPGTFFYNLASCWGWGTWKRAWDKFNPNAADLYGEIKKMNAWDRFNVEGSCKSFEDQLLKNIDGSLKSWAIKWYASVFVNNGFCLHPKYSLVKNIGFDGTGINSSKSTFYDAEICSRRVKLNKSELVENILVRKAMKNFYRNSSKMSSFMGTQLYNYLLKNLLHMLEPLKIFFKSKFLYEKYKNFTMIPKNTFIANLFLAWKYNKVVGEVVECGVWRGGMMAALAELLGDNRTYYLFDSFEGLPPAQDVDGELAKKWQADKLAPSYFDNCTAEEAEARKTMVQSNTLDYKIIKGWFEKSLVNFLPNKQIAILRLDGDWYESTMTCLNKLYRYVAIGGVIIIDDYGTWEGCKKAVDEFITKNNISSKVLNYKGVSYLIKNF